MHNSAITFRNLAFSLAAAVGLAFSTAAALGDDYLETLQIGTTTYSNVTVLTKTPNDIFFKHSYGFGNTKVREVDRATLRSLGYELPPDESERQSVFSQGAQTVLESPAMTNFVADPRVQEAQALITANMGDVLEKITPQVIYGFVASIIAVYLLYCFCCRQICVKTGQKASPLVWLPILKEIPLLRAAGIPAWWLVPGLLLFPVAWPILQIWWGFKIAETRGKSWLVGVLLLLPITNVLAFLYLAFSGTGTSAPAKSNVISLGAPPRQRAAA